MGQERFEVRLLVSKSILPQDAQNRSNSCGKKHGIANRPTAIGCKSAAEIMLAEAME
jgi:hypothetical protein